jgi:hypothetical protein
MYGVETTPGVAVTPTIGVPLVDASMKLDGDRVESAGIIAGRRVLASSQWNGGNFTPGGDVQHELHTNGLGPLFKAMFGSVATTGAGPYTHVFTPGDLSDDSLTVQIGEPATNGTVYPFTWGGQQVASWEIGCQQGAVGTIGLTFTGMNAQAGSRVVTDGVTTNASTTITSATAAFSAKDIGKTVSGTGIPAGATIVSLTAGSESTSAVLSAAATAAGTGLSITIGMPLATAVYSSTAQLFKFNHLSVSVGGSVAQIKNATFAGDNGLDADRRFLGSQLPAQPLEADLRSYTGTLDKEFKDLTMYERFLDGAEAAVSAVFARGASTLTIAGNARFDANPPEGKGRGLLTQSVPIKFVGSTTDASALTVTLVNTDATP